MDSEAIYSTYRKIIENPLAQKHYRTLVTLYTEAGNQDFADAFTHLIATRYADNPDTNERETKLRT